MVQSGGQVIKDPYINPIIYQENTLVDEVWFGSVTGSCSIQLIKVKDFIVHSLGDVSQEVKDDYFSICRGEYQAISTIWSSSVNKIYSFIYTSSSNDFELSVIDETSGFEAVKQQHRVPCKIKGITDTKLQSLYNRKAAEYRFEEINGSIKTILVLPYDADNSLICLTDNEAIVNYYLYNKYQGWYPINIVASDYAGQLTNLLFTTVKSAAILAGITAAAAVAGEAVIVELGFSVVEATAVEILTEATLWTIQGNTEEAKMALMGGVVGSAVASILREVAKKAWTAWRARKVGKKPKIVHVKPSGNNTPDPETIEDLFDYAIRPVDQGGAGLSNAQLSKLQSDFDGNPELITFMFKPGAVRAWEGLSDLPASLRTIDNVKAVYAFEAANPGSLNRIGEILSTTHADKIKASRRQAFINGLNNVSNNNTLVLTNKRLANVDEVKDAVNNLREFRKANQQVPETSNIGQVKGQINGQEVYPVYNSHETWVGGEHHHLTPRPANQPPIWQATEVPSNSGGSPYLRDIDSEYNMLTDLARKLEPNATNGTKYLNHTGEIKIVSEIGYCSSCQGIIQNFNDMFPNVKVVLIDGIK